MAIFNSTDSNVPIQTSSNDTSNQRKNISNILPWLLADTLVRQGKSELALEGVYERAIQQIGNANQ